MRVTSYCLLHELPVISYNFYKFYCTSCELLFIARVATSNNMFGRAIRNKLPECVFENFEIARVKQGQFQNFQKSRG